MNLEQQVCSRPLAEKLRDLGVKQESYLKWNEPFVTQTAIQMYGHSELKPRLFTEEQWENYAEDYDPPTSRMFSAFTVAELFEHFPMHHNYGAPDLGKANDGSEYLAGYTHWYNLHHDEAEYDKYQLPPFLDKNPANACAKMLIYLLENKLIAV